MRESSPHRPVAPISSPAKTIGTPGSPTARLSAATWRSCEPTTVRMRAVSWLPRMFQLATSERQGMREWKARSDATAWWPVIAGTATGSPGRVWWKSGLRSHDQTWRVKPA